jgi:hypothetical protein
MDSPRNIKSQAFHGNFWRLELEKDPTVFDIKGEGIKEVQNNKKGRFHF